MVANGAAVLIGLLVGVTAGYFRGWVETVLMRLTDVMTAFPALILAIAQAIQADLAEIGVRAELRTQAQSTVIEAGGAGEAPLLWSGGMAWIADYPDPNNFYWPILACASNIPGGWNWARYCDESIEARAAHADTLARADQQAERVAE